MRHKGSGQKKRLSKSPDQIRKHAKPLQYIGPGMFPSPEELAGRRRSCRVAFAIIKDLKKRSTKDLPNPWDVYKIMLEITRSYWAAVAYDEQLTFAAMKPELRRLQKDISSVLNRLKSLSPTARRELNRAAWKRSDESRIDRVGAAEASLGDLPTAIDLICDPHDVRTGATAVPDCCDALAKIYESMTKRSFSYTKDVHPPSSETFTYPGSIFVKEAIQAIDPNVPFSRVRSWLASQENSRPR